MAEISLKRILKRKENVELFQEVVDLLSTVPAVLSDDGELVWGNPEAVGDSFAVTEASGRILGHVRGAGPAPATLLSRLVAFEQTRKSLANDGLEKYRRLSLLYTIAEMISTNLDPQQVGQLVIDGALRLIAADRASVMLHDPRQKFLEILSAHGTELEPGQKVSTHMSVFDDVLESGRAEIVNDALADPRFVPGVIKVSSLLIAPLKVGDRNIGLLYVTSEEPKEYTAEDLSLISALAAQAASSIEHAFLFRNLEQKVADRTRKLEEANQILEAELREAAAYVRTLLPPPLQEGGIRTDWRFFPSTSLGGDAFGHHWLDSDRFAVYLLDVSGHGVGAALLSVSVLNLLRSRTLPEVDFGDPGQVLTSLNHSFPMELQGGKYFTMWYGVWNHRTRLLTFASAGHPPALLVPLPHDSGTTIQQLKKPGLFIGGLAETEYESSQIQLEGPSRLFLFSDGVYEIALEDGSLWNLEGLMTFLADPKPHEEIILDRLYHQVRTLARREHLEDDFSILQVDLL